MDRRVLDLCRVLLRGTDDEAHDIGLPIGNLTSQWFASLVLDRLDHPDDRVPRYWAGDRPLSAPSCRRRSPAGSAF
jgi:hypothetical protein